MKIDTIDSLLDVKINEDVHTSESSEKMQRYIEETIILFKEVFKKEWKKSKRIFKI